MEALGLTEEQAGKVNDHKSGETQRFQEVMMKNQGSGMAKALKKLRTDSATELAAILTEAQRLKFKEIIGPECKAATKRADSVF